MTQQSPGFTLIELVMAIVLLGVLSVVAVPRYANLKAQASAASTKSVVGSIRAGIYITHITNLANHVVPAYPSALGGRSGSCSNRNPCFGNVLEQAITQQWSCLTSGRRYTIAASSPTAEAVVIYTYNPITGTFSA